MRNGTHPDPPAMSSEEYQAELIEQLLRVAGQGPFVAGTHIWTFADIATGPGRPPAGVRQVQGRVHPKLAAQRLREL